MLSHEVITQIDFGAPVFGAAPLFFGPAIERRTRMSDSPEKQEILAAVGSVEHPAIAATLLELGMVRDVTVSPDNAVTLTFALPFVEVPANIRNLMINSIAAAVQGVGGELTEVTVTLMDDEERKVFLEKEQRLWRGR